MTLSEPSPSTSASQSQSQSPALEMLPSSPASQASSVVKRKKRRQASVETPPWSAENGQVLEKLAANPAERTATKLEFSRISEETHDKIEKLPI